MRFSSFLCFATVLALICSGAKAQTPPPERTASTLVEACKSQDPTILMRCNAYLGGIADSMDFLAVYQQVHGKALHKAKLTVVPFAICHTEPWTSVSLRSTYLNWADKNQDRLQGDQYVAVVDALQESMSCNK